MESLSLSRKKSSQKRRYSYSPIRKHSPKKTLLGRIRKLSREIKDTISFAPVYINVLLVANKLIDATLIDEGELYDTTKFIKIIEKYSDLFNFLIDIYEDGLEIILCHKGISYKKMRESFRNVKLTGELLGYECAGDINLKGGPRPKYNYRYELNADKLGTLAITNQLCQKRINTSSMVNKAKKWVKFLKYFDETSRIWIVLYDTTEDRNVLEEILVE